MKIQKTAIIGMGALGLLYADYITKQKGQDAVFFVMNKKRCEKYAGQKFDCNGIMKEFCMVEDEKATPADLVIVAVKYNGLNSALDTIKNCVDNHTIIMSVMNGITSEDFISERYGDSNVIYTVAQGMDAMKFNNKLTYTKMGELRIGITDTKKQPILQSVVDFFNEIRMPYSVDDDILHRLWSKFMLNVGVNQTCMVFETNYGGVLKEGKAHDTMLAAMREVINVGNAEGIGLSEDDLNYYINILGTLLPEGMPSMRQDGVSKRPSEVEMFAGTVMKLAKKHGIEIPANQFLYDSVKEIEKAYTAS